MKERLLDYLVCPRCKGPLRLEAQARMGQEITEGHLRCPADNAEYPIVRGIPRFVKGQLSTQKKRSASAWGYQWQEFTEMFDQYEADFLDWIHPVKPEDFRDKVVLDAGCGMARLTVFAAKYGAKDVIGFDLSDAVEVAYQRSLAAPNMHILQADIYNLPFGRPFDLAYCVGVLHHLPDPVAGFQRVVGSVRPGGLVAIWVYGRENNEWIVRYLNPLRERFFSRMPKDVLWGASLAIALPLEALLRCVYRPLNASPDLASHAARLPYNSYLRWLSHHPFRHNHHVVFDHLVAPTAYYLPRGEVAGWFAQAGMKDVILSSRNGNSWRGCGRV